VKIVIIGAGQIGSNLVKRLSQENHEVILIDIDPQKVKKTQENLDIMAIHGSGSSINVLDKAGIKGADMLVAVTDKDEINIVSCMIAGRFNVATKIARIKDAEFSTSGEILTGRDLGIDMMINPELLTATRIAALIRQANATDLIGFFDGRIQILGLHIDEQFNFLGQPLKDVTQHFGELNFRTIAVRRRQQTLIPTGDNCLLSGDQVFVMAETEDIPRLIDIAGLKPLHIENVMILGGGHIGVESARLLEKDFNVKIIESSQEKSAEIAKGLNNALVICGDGTEIDLLAQEGIVEMDAFVAVTGKDETNIISTLMAKHLKIPRTIALVNNTDYIPITPSIGLETTVSKQMITVNAILKYIRRGEIISIDTLQGIDAEAIELVPKKGAKITKKPLKDIHFPKGAIVGAVLHEETVFVPVGDSRIQAGDKTVVFALPEAIHKVEALFD